MEIKDIYLKECVDFSICFRHTCEVSQLDVKILWMCTNRIFFFFKAELLVWFILHSYIDSALTTISMHSSYLMERCGSQWISVIVHAITVSTALLWILCQAVAPLHADHRRYFFRHHHHSQDTLYFWVLSILWLEEVEKWGRNVTIFSLFNAHDCLITWWLLLSL